MKRTEASFFIGLLACFLPIAFGNYAAPTNIHSNVTSRSVYVTWDPVDDVTGYKIRLTDPATNNQIQAAESQSAEAAFAGLMADTLYEVGIRGSDLNGTDGAEATHEFVTNLAAPEDITVFEATAGTIEIEWKRTNVSSYEVRVTTDDDVPIEVDISKDDISAYIEGLDTMTYYKIYVRAISDDGRSSDETLLRARTDGSGIRVTDWWESPQGGLKGKATIFRPLQIPPGLYRMRVHFPCAVQNWTFWHVHMDDDESDPDDGFFLLFQNQTWQWRKTEIGVVFNYGLGAGACIAVNENITVDFGDDLAPKETSKKTDVRIEQNEWKSSLREEGEVAGMLKLRLDDLYHGTNHNDKKTETSIQKPLPGSYVIAVDAGEGCQGGLAIKVWWGMTRKDTQYLEEHKVNVHYFTQKKTGDWTNNQPGLLYSYDPAICPSRSNITSYILEDSKFVDSVYGSYDYTL